MKIKRPRGVTANMVHVGRMAVGEIPNDKAEHLKPGDPSTADIIRESLKHINNGHEKAPDEAPDC